MHRSSLPEGVDPLEAMSCLVPQGISGCEHAAPLAAAHAAVGDQLEPGGLLDWPYGLSSVFVVSPGVDCSITPEGAAAFDPAGDRALWTDPEAQAPTPAVCWRAGVQCTGQPPDYDDCERASIGLDGQPVAQGETPVLVRTSDYEERLALVSEIHGLFGVAEDGYPDYGTDGDPAFVEHHGIAAGCRDETLAAVPPVRMQWLIGERHSICSADYGEALASALKTSFGVCLTAEQVADVTIRYETPEGPVVDIPTCGGTDPVRTVPEGAPACYAWRENPWRCPNAYHPLELVLRTNALHDFGLFSVTPDWLSSFDRPPGWD